MRSPRLADRDVTVRIEAAEFLCIAIRPSNPDLIDSLRFSQTEMDSEIVLGKIAASATNLGDLFPTESRDFNASADGAAVASRAFQPEADPVVGLVRVVSVKAW